jgi:hypothetical protein
VRLFSCKFTCKPLSIGWQKYKGLKRRNVAPKKQNRDVNRAGSALAKTFGLHRTGPCRAGGIQSSGTTTMKNDNCLQLPCFLSHKMYHNVFDNFKADRSDGSTGIAISWQDSSIQHICLSHDTCMHVSKIPYDADKACSKGTHRDVMPIVQRNLLAICWS